MGRINGLAESKSGYVAPIDPRTGRRKIGRPPRHVTAALEAVNASLAARRAAEERRAAWDAPLAAKDAPIQPAERSADGRVAPGSALASWSIVGAFRRLLSWPDPILRAFLAGQDLPPEYAEQVNGALRIAGARIADASDRESKTGPRSTELIMDRIDGPVVKQVQTQSISYVVEVPPSLPPSAWASRYTPRLPGVEPVPARVLPDGQEAQESSGAAPGSSGAAPGDTLPESGDTEGQPRPG